jgi:hypothetical protein
MRLSFKATWGLEQDSVARFAVNRNCLPPIGENELLTKPKHKCRLIGNLGFSRQFRAGQVLIAVRHMILRQFLERRESDPRSHHGTSGGGIAVGVVTQRHGILATR